jgi:hypothetical protein
MQHGLPFRAGQNPPRSGLSHIQPHKLAFHSNRLNATLRFLTVFTYRTVSQYDYGSFGWMIGGSSPTKGWEFFSSPPRPDRLCGPTSLLFNVYQGLFPWGQSGRGVELTTHLHLVPRSRIRRTIPPFPQYAFMAWCSLKAQGQLYLTSVHSMTLSQLHKLYRVES